MQVAWLKSDTKIIIAIHTNMVSLNPRWSVTHNGHNTWKLYINSVEPEDSGTYMCQLNTEPMKSQVSFVLHKLNIKKKQRRKWIVDRVTQK